jgi:hypothetical protein
MKIATKRLALVAAGMLMVAAAASAAPPRAVVVVPHIAMHPMWSYDPLWSPWWYPPMYPYAVTTDDDSRIKASVTPKNAQLWVDGYYAGRAGDVSPLHVVSGGHTITFFLDGFRTVSEDVYVRPHSTFKLTESMVPLGHGETSAPVAPPAT